MSASFDDFLFELITEELPPKALKHLASAFADTVIDGVKKAGLTFGDYELFATPRRLAILIRDLAPEQPAQKIERRGPSIDSAYDASGTPTKAAQGFAASCGVPFDALQTIKNEKGAWLYHIAQTPGKSVAELMPAIIQHALDKLPVPKVMHWGNAEHAFIRPAQHVTMLYGSCVIPAKFFHLTTENHTHGHRFHHPKKVLLSQPREYETALQNAFVIASFENRRNTIRAQVEKLAASLNATPIMPDHLLDEVTSLVEWPVALQGEFESRFLAVPKEVLILSMQTNQKYFALLDANENLLPYFITIANIESHDSQQVIKGNQRVMRARLSDAEFFFQTDKKTKLADRIDALNQVVFQKQLGTLGEKTRRVVALCKYLANKLDQDASLAMRAALLSKTDLLTNMVGEFPELQGVMGRYYALAEGEPQAVATALDEQYQPRFSGGALPHCAIGQILALADRIDTVVGIFGINLAPTGDKDPFGLRRATLGILRILIEKELNLNLQELVEFANTLYENKLSNAECVPQVLAFCQDRLKYWAQEQGIRPDVFACVAAKNIQTPLDFKRRLDAVSHFITLPQAKNLAAANKRVNNILSKLTGAIAQNQIDRALLQLPSEKTLATLVEEKSSALNKMNYEAKLTELASLQQPIDHFFEEVMVMVDDEKLRNNRIALLNALRKLFLQVADIALLQ